MYPPPAAAIANVSVLSSGELRARFGWSLAQGALCPDSPSLFVAAPLHASSIGLFASQREVPHPSAAPNDVLQPCVGGGGWAVLRILCCAFMVLVGRWLFWLLLAAEFRLPHDTTPSMH